MCWGLMILLAWATRLWWGAVDAVIWAAMEAGAPLLSLSYLPAYIGVGCKPTVLFVGMTLHRVG